jgi:hypothetical protein
MADSSAIRAHFEDQNLHYFTFHHKSEKPIKAVISGICLMTHLQKICPDLGFDVISVK